MINSALKISVIPVKAQLGAFCVVSGSIVVLELVSQSGAAENIHWGLGKENTILDLGGL